MGAAQTASQTAMAFALAAHGRGPSGAPADGFSFSQAGRNAATAIPIAPAPSTTSGNGRSSRNRQMNAASANARLKVLSSARARNPQQCLHHDRQHRRLDPKEQGRDPIEAGRPRHRAPKAAGSRVRRGSRTAARPPSPPRQPWNFRPIRTPAAARSGPGSKWQKLSAWR